MQIWVFVPKYKKAVMVDLTYIISYKIFPEMVIIRESVLSACQLAGAQYRRQNGQTMLGKQKYCKYIKLYCSNSFYFTDRSLLST